MSEKFIGSEACSIDPVPYQETPRYYSLRTSPSEYGYLSPLRARKTVTFRADQRHILWYDRGARMGSVPARFMILSFNGPIEVSRNKLSLDSPASFSFHPPLPSTPPIFIQPEERKVMVSAGDGLGDSLKGHIAAGKTSECLALRHCREIRLILCGKPNMAPGFPNHSGDYTLHNTCFKSSPSPKDINLLCRKKNTVIILKDNFSFPAYLQLNPEKRQPEPNLLVLYSLPFSQRASSAKEKYRQVLLCLDRGQAGRKATQKVSAYSPKYRDQNNPHQNHIYLHELLMAGKKIGTQDQQHERSP